MPGSRRFLRRQIPIAETGYDVEFYTEPNYAGDMIGRMHGDEIAYIGDEFNDRIQSIKHNRPSKVYMFNDIDFDGYFLLSQESIPDLSKRYYDFDSSIRSFDRRLTSYRVWKAGYRLIDMPGTPYTIGDGSIIPARAGSEKYGILNILNVTIDPSSDIQTQNAFISKFPQNDWKTQFTQIARNAASVIFTSPDQLNRRRNNISVLFDNDPGSVASFSNNSGSLVIGRWFTDHPGSWAGILTHEFVHSVQIGMPSNPGIYSWAIIEGIADYVLIRMGYHTAGSHRPAGGGDTWYSGYDTTAFFLYYIEYEAPVPTPNFVHNLMMSMDRADPAIADTPYWNPAVITSLNARNMTVDQLWTEYKASLA